MPTIFGIFFEELVAKRVGNPLKSYSAGSQAYLTSVRSGAKHSCIFQNNTIVQQVMGSGSYPGCSIWRKVENPGLDM